MLINRRCRIFDLCLIACLFCCLSSTAYAQASAEKLVRDAIAQTQSDVTYDGRYFTIPYPNGDVPAHLGVCTDVVIRAYRVQGIDLQKLVHEDMKAHFNLYPKLWQLKRADTNIDHRRVPICRSFSNASAKACP